MIEKNENIKLITLNYVKKTLPTRSKKSSKIDGGKVLIIGGGKNFFGAGIIATLAATKSGAGYTHLMTDFKEFPWLKFPDFIVHTFSSQKINKYKDYVIGIGPGLGLTSPKKKIIATLIKNKLPKIIVDGDALTILSQLKIKKLPSTWILTPHEGELARLMGTTSTKVKSDRFFYVRAAQKKFGCIVILKGAETFIADFDKTYAVSVGTKSLAKAGSGDALVGVIAAMYAQGLNPLDAAITGCYLHGYSSRLWLKKNNDYLSMRPTDLIDMLPHAIYKLRRAF
ncbi:MAG: NAD(P)H-hydrate dehydratase [Bdellovibrionales bacterium]|nr:NAD(P)H-hydrate dehydratase [Bdellovibrionales bacterium]